MDVLPEELYTHICVCMRHRFHDLLRMRATCRSFLTCVHAMIDVRTHAHLMKVNRDLKWLIERATLDRSGRFENLCRRDFGRFVLDPFVTYSVQRLTKIPACVPVHWRITPRGRLTPPCRAPRAPAPRNKKWSRSGGYVA